MKQPQRALPTKSDRHWIVAVSLRRDEPCGMAHGFCAHLLCSIQQDGHSCPSHDHENLPKRRLSCCDSRSTMRWCAGNLSDMNAQAIRNTPGPSFPHRGLKACDAVVRIFLRSIQEQKRSLCLSINRFISWRDAVDDQTCSFQTGIPPTRGPHWLYAS